jgi:DNA-directed RNA polymerase subunit L
MKPVITKKPYTDDNDIYRFTISNIHVSLANALRRIILSDIETIVFYTETYQDNKCTIHKNTCRLHNEIVKQRLSSIPIFSQDQNLVHKYILEVNEKNDTDAIIYVTTEHFRIKNKENGNYLNEQMTREIFPPNPITGTYIDFVRLRPKIGDTIVGEEIHLTCEFSVSSAKINSMFNVVSKCTYGNTPDQAKIETTLQALKQKWAQEGLKPDEIVFQAKNFMLLDAERQFIEHSFDFALKTIGPLSNETILNKGCKILEKKFADFSDDLKSDQIQILRSETTIEHCFDVTLEGEDYTVGKVLEYILYEKYYMEEQIFSFCGFKKLHPHNNDSVLRIAYKDNIEIGKIKEHLNIAASDAAQVFHSLGKMFKD